MNKFDFDTVSDTVSNCSKVQQEQGWAQVATERAKTIAVLKKENEVLKKQLKEAEEALLESQTERDQLQNKLDAIHPPWKPNKYV
jgi:hypothetical protein